MLVSHLGSNVVLHKVAQRDSNYDGTNPDAIKIIQREVDERLAAYPCLENNDKNKCG